MALSYQAGTVSIDNGAQALVGVETAWLGVVQQGDLFTADDDHFYELSSVNSDASITLDRAFAETTLSAASYKIYRISSALGNVASLTVSVQDLIGNYRGVLNVANNDRYMTLNKLAAANTAGVVLQTDGSNRYRFGTLADDVFKVQYSGDGSTWSDGFSLDRATGVLTVESLAAESLAIDSLDDTPIGATTPSTGKFTQLDVDNIRIDANAITSTDTNGNINLTPNGSGKVVSAKVAFTGGSIDGVAIGASTPSTIDATSVAATGAVSGASVSATGAVSGATVTATGAVSGASVAATGAVSGASVTATGSLDGARVVVDSGTLANCAVQIGAANNGLYASGSNINVVRDGSSAMAFGASAISSEFIRLSETASGSNVNINGGTGLIARSTSKLAVKDNIEAITDEEIGLFLQLNGITYTSKCAIDDPNQRFFGVVADQADELGLNSLVGYNEQGEVEQFYYDRCAAFSIEVAKRHNGRLDNHDATIADLESRIAALEAA